MDYERGRGLSAEPDSSWRGMTRPRAVARGGRAMRASGGVLLALAGLLALPAPAAAQTAIWSGTLTVGQVSDASGTSTGYNSGATDSAVSGAVYGSLTDTEFDLGGTSYTITRITLAVVPAVSLDNLQVRITPALGDIGQRLTLHLGSDSFALSAGTAPAQGGIAFKNNAAADSEPRRRKHERAVATISPPRAGRVYRLRRREGRHDAEALRHVSAARARADRTVSADWARGRSRPATRVPRGVYLVRSARGGAGIGVLQVAPREAALHLAEVLQESWENVTAQSQGIASCLTHTRRLNGCGRLALTCPWPRPSWSALPR